jgi:hypothetical protein
MNVSEVLEKTGTDNMIQTNFFYQLIKEFRISYLISKSYYERLELHRNPIEVKNEVLQELYSYLLQIQGREEMRHFDIEKKSSSYVPTIIIDIWRSDKRIRSLYAATRKYCESTGKNFNIIAAHIAEYRAMNKVVGLIRRSIYKANKSAVTAAEISPANSKKNRKKIPQESKIRAELQKEISSKCPFCDNTDVGHFHIHHIDSDPAHNDKKNLLLVCPNCHSKMTKGDISQEIVESRKKELHNSISTRNQKKTKTINFNSSVNNAIIGDNNVIKITESKKGQKLKYPPGCIGYETVKANYVSHLINRYNQYKEYETGKGNVKYAVFASHLKKAFKIGATRTIFNLPVEKFEELVLYIQSRIDGTQLAKVKGKTHKNYSTWEEYQHSNNQS